MRTACAITPLALALALCACGEKDEPEPAATEPAPAIEDTGPAQDASHATDDATEGRSRDQARGEDAGKDPSAEAAARRRAATRTVRAYIEALDAHNGAAVCDLLAPDALDDVELPREQGSCAASLNASIGYRDPRGLPQFQSVKLAGVPSAETGTKDARVTAPIVTTFADRDEPSIEDDIVYLAAKGDRYVVAKASTALYRAVGIADIPPEVISPP
jgi:hypothetical protein